MKLRILPDKVVILLLLATAALTLSSFSAVSVVYLTNWDPSPNESRMIQLLAFGYQRSLPSWFEGTMVTMSLVLLLLIALEQFQNGHQRDGGYWIVLATIFLGLSVDGALSIHQQLTVPTRAWLDIRGGILSSAWVVPASILLALLTVILIPFLKTLPTKTRRHFLAAGTIFVIGALGVEMIAGAYAAREGRDTLSYLDHLLNIAEGLLEMLGIIIFLRGVLIHLKNRRVTVEF